MNYLDQHQPRATAPAPTVATAAKKTISPKTKKLMDAIIGGMARYLRPVLENHTAKIAALGARLTAADNVIAALQQQIKALEARPVGAIDAGIHQPGKTYARGEGVTHDGHYWAAQRSTSSTPGDGDPSWRLVVRRGKTGREGRSCPNCRGAAS